MVDWKMWIPAVVLAVSGLTVLVLGPMIGLDPLMTGALSGALFGAATLNRARFSGGGSHRPARHPRALRNLVSRSRDFQ